MVTAGWLSLRQWFTKYLTALPGTKYIMNYRLGELEYLDVGHCLKN